MTGHQGAVAFLRTSHEVFSIFESILTNLVGHDLVVSDGVDDDAFLHHALDFRR